MNERRNPLGIDNAPTVVESDARTSDVGEETHELSVGPLAARHAAGPARPGRAPIPEQVTEVQRAVQALPPMDGSIPLLDRAREPPAERLDEQTAPRIGEYALVARFRSSSTADVFLGYKSSRFGFLRRAVVKWTDRHRYDYETVRQKLLDEARAISFIEHPNIVTILDLAEDAVGTYLALEYVPGTDLRRVMVQLNERGARLPAAHACLVATAVLRGLEHVHSARGPDGAPLCIVHRDVNPSNVLISEDGHVKLTDFGAVLMQGRLQAETAPGLVKGKVRYLAPEYITNQECTSHVDIYSVGVMLFEMLTGTPCFLAKDETATMFKIVSEGLPFEDLRRAGVDAELERIIQRATRRDPLQRHTSALEMVGELEAWMESSGIFTTPTRFARYLQAQGLMG